MKLPGPALRAISLALTAAVPLVPASVEDLPVGEPPPDFTLARTDGGEVTLHGEGGRPTVLVFGELYQENTRRALADLSDLITQAERGAAIEVLVIVSEDRPADALEAERQGLGIVFPVLMDPGRTVFAAYGVISAIPCTVFLDADGNVHRAVAGYGVSYVDTAERELAFLTGRISEEELRAELEGPTPEDSRAARMRRRVRLGDQLRRRGFNGQAREQYETVLMEAPGNIEAHLGLAHLELTRSELSSAEEHVRAALEQRPHLPRALKALARIQIQRGDTEAAEVTLQDLLHRAGEDVRTLYLLGRLSEARGDQSEAVRHYRQVSEALLTEEGW